MVGSEYTRKAVVFKNKPKYAMPLYNLREYLFKYN